ncbi:MAG: mannose-1-phosphate guanylyltransferase [Prevotella sp.]|nr:mannose-1-phosphate guanylyltransferase [Prevotella sp.]MCM1075134.1 mannose-1-phosphate guanylyltransferase [Ruminococcus sp.]
MNPNKSHRYCVVMCGGVGSRFWPFSRTMMPKQFLDFFGTGSSLLQMTVERIRPLVPVENIILVSNEAYKPLLKSQLPEIPEENILLEPARRNTAPCVCWAAHHIYARDPEASIMTLPSDHLILKERAFQEAMDAGLSYVENHDALLTLGIKPTAPETGYGYIQQGVFCTENPKIAKVRCFTEKPTLEMARVLLASGDFLWNSGIFLWRADTILKAFEALAPDIAEVFDAGKDAYGTDRETSFINETFQTSPSISIDYAVMEKAANVYVMPVDLGWSDLGTWGALYDISPKNSEGNVTQNCKLITRECAGSVFAIKGDKIVVASGLQNYIVAENGNALLIAPRSQEQEIRTMVNEVKTRFGEDYI